LTSARKDCSWYCDNPQRPPGGFRCFVLIHRTLIGVTGDRQAADVQLDGVVDEVHVPEKSVVSAGKLPESICRKNAEVFRQRLQGQKQGARRR
jgi:hypothetical protein